jgi:hypothetical protein
MRAIFRAFIIDLRHGKKWPQQQQDQHPGFCLHSSLLVGSSDSLRTRFTTWRFRMAVLKICFIALVRSP